MSNQTFLGEWMPSETILPDYISRFPERIISIPINFTADGVKKVAEIGEKGTATYKNYQEGEVARRRAAVLKTFNKRFPDLLDDFEKVLGSSQERDRAIAGSVRQMADHYERGSETAFSSSCKSVSEAANSMKKNAASIDATLFSTGKSVSEAADSIKTAAQEIVPEIHGVRFMAKSLCMSVAAIAVIMEQMVSEIKQVNRNLENIREELWRTNVLTSSGGAGESGFAQVVYNFVNMEAGRGQYQNDCFFVWHPDTSWHPAFYAKVKEAPLPATFMGESNCLDRLCIAMKAIRQGMKEQGEDKVPTFHILIPSWYNIAVPDPLHFPDEILPLRLVGPRHDGGKPLVSFVLPHCQRSLTLQGIENTFKEKLPDEDTTDKITLGIEFSSFLGGGFGGFFAGLVLATGLGISASPLSMVVVIPMFYGGVLSVARIRVMQLESPWRTVCLTRELECLDHEMRCLRNEFVVR